MANNQQGGSFDPKRDVELSGTVTISGPVTFSDTVSASGGSTITSAVVTPKLTVYASDGAIAVESGTAVLTKGSAGAYTLAAPTVDGTTIVITAGTSFAHVVTGTNLFWAGETGGPFNKITTAAFIGSSATVVAYNGLWHVVSDQIATVGD